MKRNRLCPLGLVFVLATAVAAQAAPASTLNFSESLKDSIVCERDEGEIWCDVYTSGSFSISATFRDVDASKIDKDTFVSIDMGSSSWGYFFWEDGSFDPRKKTVKFVEYDYDDFDREICYLIVSIKWNSSSLTVSIKGKTPDYTFPVLADYYQYEYTGLIDEIVPATVGLLSGQSEWLIDEGFNVHVRGNVTTKEVRKHGEEYTTSKVALKGIGEHGIEEPTD